MKKLFLLLASLSSCFSAAAQNGPSRQRIPGLAQVKILAGNSPVSLRFYSKTFDLAHDLNRKLPEGTFVLNPFQDILVFPAPTPAPTNLIDEITFSTDDIPGLPRYLVSRHTAVS